MPPIVSLSTLSLAAGTIMTGAAADDDPPNVMPADKTGLALAAINREEILIATLSAAGIDIIVNGRASVFDGH